jgi:hypothetical protein
MCALYRKELTDVLTELAAAPDPLRRESLLEAQEGLEFVIPQLEAIADIQTAFEASRRLAHRIEGLHPAIIVQIVSHARDQIDERLLTPLHATIPQDQARHAAVRFLQAQINPGDRQAPREVSDVRDHALWQPVPATYLR